MNKHRRGSGERESGIENKTDDTYHSIPDTLHQYPHMLCSVTVKNRAQQLPVATGFSTMKSKTSNLLQCHSKIFTSEPHNFFSCDTERERERGCE